MKTVLKQYLVNLDTLKSKPEDEMFDEIVALTELTFGDSYCGGYLSRALEAYSEHLSGEELLIEMTNLTQRLLDIKDEETETLMPGIVYDFNDRDQFVLEKLKESGSPLTIEQIREVLDAENAYGQSIGIYSVPEI